MCYQHFLNFRHGWKNAPFFVKRSSTVPKPPPILGDGPLQGTTHCKILLKNIYLFKMTSSRFSLMSIATEQPYFVSVAHVDVIVILQIFFVILITTTISNRSQKFQSFRNAQKMFHTKTGG